MSKGFLIRAAIICGVFAICHLLGLREYTSVLCGTPPSGWMSREMGAFFGLLYILLYFAVVLVVPVLVIGAGVFAALQRLLPAKEKEEAE